MKRVLLIVAVAIVLLTIAQEIKIIPHFDITLPFHLPEIKPPTLDKIDAPASIYDESVITRVVDEALPSVVTVSVTTSGSPQFEFDPTNPFSPFRQVPGTSEEEVHNIGSGFIITADGLIVTNKHVVSDTGAKYTVLTSDEKSYPVERIYRDPLNDAAILKINATGLKPLKLGNSENLRLGQLAIAIGTPLGEFTNTVTVGIISGLGRGITAGSPLQGFVEKLDNVIQTDAAISPGNSGGPLLNSRGEVIGINTAVAQEGQNIGFALPVNVIKDLIDTFNRNGGTFERPYIGIRYNMIDNENAKAQNISPGAYVIQVVDGSPAEKGGLQDEDIITRFDSVSIDGTDDQVIAKILIDKKIGDTVQMTVWRDGKLLERTLVLEAAPDQ